MLEEMRQNSQQNSRPLTGTEPTGKRTVKKHKLQA